MHSQVRMLNSIILGISVQLFKVILVLYERLLQSLQLLP